jgi:hypothetical protein
MEAMAQGEAPSRCPVSLDPFQGAREYRGSLQRSVRNIMVN